MNWVDAAIAGIVAVYALLGLKRGFLAVASELLALALGLGVAFLLFRPVGAQVSAMTGIKPGLAQLAVFAVLFVLVQIGSSVGFHLLLKRVPKETTKSATNRVLGIFPSLVKGVVAAALVVTLLSVAPSGNAARDVRRSALGQRMVDTVIRYEESAYNTFRDVIGDLQTSIGRKPVVNGFRELPFKTTDVETVERSEEKMLQLLNEARAENGLSPVVMDETLRHVARLHSKDMLARGYFSHDSPEGKTPFERMREGGVRYRMAGENLAFALTVEVAHEGLMKSPGHRKNILTPEYRRVGIGAVKAGARGTMFTQNFAN